MTTLASGSSITFGLAVDQTFEMSFADGTTGTITVTGSLGSPYRTTFGPAKKNNWKPLPLGTIGRVVVACTAGGVSYTLGESLFVTAVTDAVTGDQIRLSTPVNIPYGNPPSLDWLGDTLHGLDIYSKGFVRAPTLFFDPTASTSLGLGTLRNPYTTQAQLQGAISGDMTGQVLGFKRGTTLRVTGTNGLLLAVYGTAANPFTMCPYGDAEALPIITAGEVVAWTIEDAGANIWKTTQASNTDAWQDDVRLIKKTYSASAVATLTTEGTSTYTGTTLYIRPFNGENPNLGQMEVAVSDTTLYLQYANVAATGHIHVAGLHTRKSRNNCFRVGRGSYGSISTVDNISIVGCRSDGAGRDVAGGNDGFIVYGSNDSHRLSNLYMAGNYTEDVVNNAYEVANISGAVLEHNRCYDVRGNGIEMFQSNNDVICRYNYLDYLKGSLGRPHTSPGGLGIRFGNTDESTGLNDAGNTKNANNVVVFNLITRYYGNAVYIEGGTGHKYQHNTSYEDPDFTRPGVDTTGGGWYTSGNAATGFIDISNNIFYTKHGIRTYRYTTWGRVNTNPLSAAASVPSGNNNVYFNDSAAADGSFVYNGAGQTNITTYKAALAAYGMDQNSLTGDVGTGATLTATSLGFNETTYRPLAAAIAGLTTLTGIGTRYQDGMPYVAASCTIGALLGT